MRLDEHLGARTVINIDKQRVAAVRKLEALGYSFDGYKWMPPSLSEAAGPRTLMTPCIACWCSGQMPSRAPSNGLRKSVSSPPSPTRSRLMKPDAGQRGKCLGERARFVCAVEQTHHAV